MVTMLKAGPSSSCNARATGTQVPNVIWNLGRGYKTAQAATSAGSVRQQLKYISRIKRFGEHMHENTSHHCVGKKLFKSEMMVKGPTDWHSRSIVSIALGKVPKYSKNFTWTSSRKSELSLGLQTKASPRDQKLHSHLGTATSWHAYP